MFCHLPAFGRDLRKWMESHPEMAASAEAFRNNYSAISAISSPATVPSAPQTP